MQYELLVYECQLYLNWNELETKNIMNSFVNVS